MTQVLADVFTVSGDGGELAGPEGDGIGGIGLDGENTHSEDGRKKEERASAGDRVKAPAEKGGGDEPQKSAS